MLIMFQIPEALAGEICFLLEPQKAVWTSVHRRSWVQFRHCISMDLKRLKHAKWLGKLICSGLEV